MKIDNEKLKELLVKPGYISEDDFNAVREEAGNKKIDLPDFLVEKNLIKDEQLGRLIANNNNFSFINLRNEKVDIELLNLIPEPVARVRGAIVFGKAGEEVKVGMIDPGDLEMIHILEKRFKASVKPYLITKRDLREAMIAYKKSLSEEMAELIGKINNRGGQEEEKNKLNVEIVNLLLEHGFYNKASDIHIEPYREKIVVRFRIDGILHDVLDLPKEYGEHILARIKILAKMRIDEHRAAQDGKFRFRVKEKNMDIRVSIVPVTRGENIVMRLLATESRFIGLEDLGMAGADLAKTRKSIKNPHGMILVTGPTGSGKTTTIYSILMKLNTKAVNISTIEDPVEYDIEGISQIQVNTKTNLTFAAGLRAIVRQDPDIIMVGEIRDIETAGIAVNSAMTGHLVLSTLHANDAVSSLPRLIDMGIEPFLTASTVKVIIAQRLLRKLCVKCRVSYELENDEIKIIENEENIIKALKKRGYNDLGKIRLFKGIGCRVCAHTGFSGRVGVFEVLEVNEKIRNLITAKAASGALSDAAKISNMTSMLDDGIEKALNGVTTIMEVLRVTKGS